LSATASMDGEGPAGSALSGGSQPAPGQRARKGSTGACDPDGPAQRGRTSVDMGLAVHDSTVGREPLAGIASAGHRRKSAGMRGHDRPEPRHRQPAAEASDRFPAGPAAPRSESKAAPAWRSLSTGSCPWSPVAPTNRHEAETRWTLPPPQDSPRIVRRSASITGPALVSKRHDGERKTRDSGWGTTNQHAFRRNAERPRSTHHSFHRG